MYDKQIVEQIVGLAEELERKRIAKQNHFDITFREKQMKLQNLLTNTASIIDITKVTEILKRNECEELFRPENVKAIAKRPMVSISETTKSTEPTKEEPEKNLLPKMLSFPLEVERRQITAEMLLYTTTEADKRPHKPDLAREISVSFYPFQMEEHMSAWLGKKKTREIDITKLVERMTQDTLKREELNRALWERKVVLKTYQVWIEHLDRYNLIPAA